MARSIVHVVGARPQFVKVAVVLRAFQAATAVANRLVHTGQHYDDNMSRVFFDELGIREPDENLGIAAAGQGAMTGRMLEALEGSLQRTMPDLVVVYGDTNSTLAGALAAAKLQIPVAHVEAGLRSFNRRMPEEINRVVTDHVSDMLLVPTKTAIENLENEGCAPDKIHLVGDVMYDSTIYFRNTSAPTTLAGLGLDGKMFALATIHRAENTDDATRLRAIVDGLAAFSDKCPVVFPVHPRTAAAFKELGWAVDGRARFHLVEPVGYLEMIALERTAALVITDSGGVQKEAFFAGTPCVTLRDETEWVELVEIGANQLLPPTDPKLIAQGLQKALNSAPDPWPETDLYGGGQAGPRIAKILCPDL